MVFMTKEMNICDELKRETRAELKKLRGRVERVLWKEFQEVNAVKVSLTNSMKRSSQKQGW